MFNDAPLRVPADPSLRILLDGIADLQLSVAAAH